MRIQDLDETLASTIAKGAAAVVPKIAPKIAPTVAHQLAAKSGLQLAEIPGFIFVNGKITQIASPIVNYSDRAIVVVQVNGHRVPFYLSSGQNAKVGVSPGSWYPMFGIGPNGWINKGREKGIASFYGSSQLKSIAAKLDSKIGDIRDQLSDTNKFAWVKADGIAAINQGLKPVSSGASITDPGFVANAHAVLKPFM